MSQRMEELSMYIRANVGPAAVWTNAQRYSIITKSFLSGVGSDVLRETLVAAADRADCSLQSFLFKYQTRITYVVLQHKLKHQIVLIYPPDDSETDIQQWNCRLLCLVLAATGCLDVREQDDVSFIERTYYRHTQNENVKLRHSAKVSKEQPKPKREWIGTCSAVQRLVENLGDTSLLLAVRNFICKVEMGAKTMDARIETHLSLAKMISELAASHSGRLNEEEQALRKHIGELVKIQQQYDAVSKPSFSTSRSSKNLSRSMVIEGKETRPLSARDKELEEKPPRSKSAVNLGMSQTNTNLGKHDTKQVKRVNSVELVTAVNPPTNAKRPFFNTGLERHPLHSVSLVTPKLSQPRTERQNKEVMNHHEKDNSIESVTPDALRNGLMSIQEKCDPPLSENSSLSSKERGCIAISSDKVNTKYGKETVDEHEHPKVWKGPVRNDTEKTVTRPHSFDVIQRNRSSSRHGADQYNQRGMTKTKDYSAVMRPNSFDVARTSRSTSKRNMDEINPRSHGSYDDRPKSSVKEIHSDITMIYSQSMTLKRKNQDKQNPTDKLPFPSRAMKNQTQRSISEKQSDALLIVSQPTFSSLMAYTTKYQRPKVRTKETFPNENDNASDTDEMANEPIQADVTEVDNKSDNTSEHSSVIEEPVKETPVPPVERKSRFGRFKDMLKNAVSSKKSEEKQDVDSDSIHKLSSRAVSEENNEYELDKKTGDEYVTGQDSGVNNAVKSGIISGNTMDTGTPGITQILDRDLNKTTKDGEKTQGVTKPRIATDTNSDDLKQTGDNSETKNSSYAETHGTVGALSGMVLNILPEKVHQNNNLDTKRNDTETQEKSLPPNNQVPPEITNESITQVEESSMVNDNINDTEIKKSSRVRFINESENQTNTSFTNNKFNQERRRRLSLPSVGYQAQETLSDGKKKKLTNLERASKSMTGPPTKAPQRRVSIASSSMHELSGLRPSNKFYKSSITHVDRENVKLQTLDEQMLTIEVEQDESDADSATPMQTSVPAIGIAKVSDNETSMKSDKSDAISTKKIMPTKIPFTERSEHPIATVTSIPEVITESSSQQLSGNPNGAGFVRPTSESEVNVKPLKEATAKIEKPITKLTSRRKSVAVSNLHEHSGNTKNPESEVNIKAQNESNMDIEKPISNSVSGTESTIFNDLQLKTAKQNGPELITPASESESNVNPLKDVTKIEKSSTGLASQRNSIVMNSFQTSSVESKDPEFANLTSKLESNVETLEVTKGKPEKTTAILASRRKSVAVSSFKQHSGKTKHPEFLRSNSESEFDRNALKDAKIKKEKQTPQHTKAKSKRKKENVSDRKNSQSDKTVLLESEIINEEEYHQDSTTVDIDRHNDIKPTDNGDIQNKTDNIKTVVTNPNDITENGKQKIEVPENGENKPEPEHSEDDSEAEMKRIANDVIVHHQVHKAAREFMDKDKTFADEFFSFLHKHKATKEFLRTEQFSPFKTMKLPNGMKAALSFLHAFTFRHINVFDRDQCNYVVEKILKRTECEEANRAKKEEDDIISRVKAEVKTRKRTPFHNTKLITMETVENIRKKKTYSNGKNPQKEDTGTQLDDPGNKRPVSALKKLRSIAICQCWKCTQKDLAMTIAVNWRNHGLCQLLLSYGIHFKMGHLLPAVRANDADNVKEIVTYLKRRLEWDTENEEARMALILARFHDMHEIVAYLETEGVQDERVVQCTCFA